MFICNVFCPGVQTDRSERVYASSQEFKEALEAIRRNTGAVNTFLFLTTLTEHFVCLLSAGLTVTLIQYSYPISSHLNLDNWNLIKIS